MSGEGEVPVIANPKKFGSLLIRDHFVGNTDGGLEIGFMSPGREECHFTFGGV